MIVKKTAYLCKNQIDLQYNNRFWRKKKEKSYEKMTENWLGISKNCSKMSSELEPFDCHGVLAVLFARKCYI